VAIVPADDDRADRRGARPDAAVGSRTARSGWRSSGTFRPASASTGSSAPTSSRPTRSSAMSSRCAATSRRR
jgi:hypothetical protein